MWKNTQSSSHGVCSKVHGRPKTTGQSLQHLSPFASHSPADSKAGTELPSGVRYIRQLPATTVRPITGRLTPTEPSRLRNRSASRDRSLTRKRDPSVTRDRSPDKAVRFGTATKTRDQLDSKNDKTSKFACIERSRTGQKGQLVRPVINPEPSNKTTEAVRTVTGKTVATSPASRHASPIFSTVNFGGDSKQTNGSKQSPLAEPSIPATIENPRSREESPIQSQRSTPLSTPESRASIDRQPIVKTQIITPGGTIKRSTSAMTGQMRSNSATHRNMSFPILQSHDHRPEQNRLSVNVNVAVGLDCNDHFGNHMQPQSQRYELFNEEEPEVIQSEDEVDLMPAVHSDKGFALKVAVRLRPFVKKEIDDNENSVIEMNGHTVRIINSENDNYNRTEFGFDVCLNSSDRDLFEFANQDQVFKRMGEPLLLKALEGYNVCLFAYGQTGSGKSFTMTGTESNPGIIPRFVHDLYRRMSSLPDVFFAIEVSYCEIYNEKIYDLLSDDKNYNKKILKIRENPQTGPFVENLSQHTADNYDDVMLLVRNGNKRRATASTAANQDSSRSHSIFTIILSQLRNNCDEVDFDVSSSCGSRINLIDLAGSERHFGTANGDRFKEGSMINKSLLNLGKVISKLADYSAHPTRATHIPYRDSALTWLLRESLGGNSQTSMIATISPAKCHLEETLSTLRYAATARRIVNYVHINEDPKTKKIRELMEIIASLRAQQIHPQDIEPKERQQIVAESHSAKFFSKCISTETETEPKVIDKISKSTNTSFVSERRLSTKGTETSFREPPEDPKNKKKTTSIATNTSFVEPRPKTHTISTSPLKGHSSKAKTASTSTEPSVRRVDMATETLEGPSAYDLLRAQKLNEDQQLFTEEVRRYREKLLSDWNECEETETLKQTRDEIAERSDTTTTSDDYFDAQEPSMESNTSGSTNKTFTIETDGGNCWGESETQTKDVQNNEWETEEPKEEANEWGTEEPKGQTEEQTDWAAQETDEQWDQRQEQADNVGNEWAAEGMSEHDCSLDIKVVGDWSVENKNGDEWQSEEATKEETKDNTGGDWAAEDSSANEWGAEESKGNECAAQDSNNEWGTDETVTEEKQDDNQWGAGGDDQWGDQNQAETKDKPEDTGNDWGADQNDGNDWDDGQNGGTDDQKPEETTDDNSWSNEWDNESNVTIREVAKQEEKKKDDNDWSDDW